LTACAETKTTTPSKEVLNYEYKEASKDAAPYPYPYQKLDVETTKERAYAGFFNKGGCCRAVIDGVIGQLSDNAGYPMESNTCKCLCKRCRRIWCRDTMWIIRWGLVQ